MAVTIEGPCAAQHHDECRADRHSGSRAGTDVPGMARHLARFSRLVVRHDFSALSLVGSVLRVDHDLPTRSQPGHDVFRSLAGRAGRDAVDLDGRMAVPALRGLFREFQRPLWCLGRDRGAVAVDTLLKLRLRVRYLFLRGIGGGAGEGRWGLARGQQVMNVMRLFEK